MDRTLLEIFATEQTEHVQRIRELVEKLSSLTPDTSGAVFDELLRRAHTLKGAARAVGLEPTERLVHRMESVFAKWRSRATIPNGEKLALIHRALDDAEDILAWTRGARSEPNAVPVLQALDEEVGLASTADGHDTPAAVRQNAPETESIVEPDAARTPSGGTSMELVRVDTALLDAVVRSASELVQAAHAEEAASVRASQHAQLVERTLHEYSRLRRNCIRDLRQNTGTSASQSVQACLEYVDRQLPQLLTDARTTVALQDRRSRSLRLLVEEVHDSACRVRMTPAQTVFGAFGVMVRELAGQEGKQIDFRAEGLEVQADREVLQALKDPVMHVLRNAVSHGIEKPEDRIAAGKPQAGMIRMRVESRDDRLRVVLEDDGRGLDTKALSQEAVRSGLMTEAAVGTASPDTLARLIFQPGLTTSATLTRLSGRGMGLSAMAQSISALQGDFRLRHQAGRGVTIALSVPMSISTQHVLLVKDGGQVFALPAAFVERLCRFRPADVRVFDGVESIVVDEKPIPLVRFATLLGRAETRSDDETSPTPSGPIYSAAILASRDDLVAVVVDELLDHRETLVKDTGLPPWATGWSAGAIALEDGSVAVMLSVARLLQRFEPAQAGGQGGFQPDPADARKTRILVVDDSVTTRAMERSLLEAQGYAVRVAVDGLEAWNMIRGDPPDLVISDVSMPRMDGFQLLDHIKADRSYAKIPVILVTSLESREEQEKGLALGADAYIVKRKFDQRELLRIVRQIV